MIVSEYARAGSLETWLKSDHKNDADIETRLEMMTGILSGLEHLHELQIIHRDLKPANVLLQGDRPRLADFGLARVLKSINYSATIAGTPDYMAPEAFENVRSEQTDLWAAGVIFYQLLAGRLPFPFKDNISPWEKILTIRTADIIPLPQSVPSSLREIIARSLQKNPDQRYKSAREMHTALRSAARSINTETDKQSTIVYPVETDVAFEQAESYSPESSLAPPDKDTEAITPEVTDKPIEPQDTVKETGDNKPTIKERDFTAAEPHAATERIADKQRVTTAPKSPAKSSPPRRIVRAEPVGNERPRGARPEATANPHVAELVGMDRPRIRQRRETDRSRTSLLSPVQWKVFIASAVLIAVLIVAYCN